MISDVIQYAIGFAGYSYFERYREDIIAPDRDTILIMINLMLVYYVMTIVKSATIKQTSTWPIEFKDSVLVFQKIIYGTIEPLIFIVFAQTLKAYLNSTSGPFFIVFSAVAIFKLITSLDNVASN